MERPSKVINSINKFIFKKLIVVCQMTLFFNQRDADFFLASKLTFEVYSEILVQFYKLVKSGQIHDIYLTDTKSQH